MLTKKQYDLLLFIDKYLKKNGVSPSFDEMRSALRLKSKSGIHRLIQGLEERRFIRHIPNKARALEIIRMPENLKAEFLQKDDSDTFVEKQFKSSFKTEFTDIPLYGKIAAGVPIEAVRDVTTTISIPSQMIGMGEYYALTVEGDSMINAGILDGDTVVIKRIQTAENGTIVVALVDGMEVTLKRFRQKGNMIALEPENPRYETRILSSDRVVVQGRLVGLMRHY